MNITISRKHAATAASILAQRAFLLDQCAHMDYFDGAINEAQFQEGKKQGDMGLFLYELSQRLWR